MVILPVTFGHGAQEVELVDSERLSAFELGVGVGGGEVDLVAVVVAELEHRRLDDEALAAFDEPAPVGAAAELAVGDDLQAGVLLQLHHIADGALLDGDELGIVGALAAVLAERLAQLLGAQQAADMIGAEGRALRVFRAIWAGSCPCTTCSFR